MRIARLVHIPLKVTGLGIVTVQAAEGGDPDHALAILVDGYDDFSGKGVGVSRFGPVEGKTLFPAVEPSEFAAVGQGPCGTGFPVPYHPGDVPGRTVIATADTGIGIQPGQAAGVGDPDSAVIALEKIDDLVRFEAVRIGRVVAVMVEGRRFPMQPVEAVGVGADPQGPLVVFENDGDDFPAETVGPFGVRPVMDGGSGGFVETVQAGFGPHPEVAAGVLVQGAYVVAAQTRGVLRIVAVNR